MADINKRGTGTGASGTDHRNHVPVDAVVSELCELSDTPFLVVHPDGRIAHLNQSFAKLVRVPAKELTGSSLLDLVPSTERESARELLKLAVVEGSLDPTTVTLLRDDGATQGTKIRIRVVPGSGNSEAPPRLALAFSLIQSDTELGEAPDLNGSKPMPPSFRVIADFTYDWETWFDTNGKLIWSNAACRRLTGYSPTELYEMEGFPESVIYAGDRERMAAIFQGAMSGTSGNDVEFRVLHQNGSLVWVAMSWQPVVDDDGSVQGVRSSVRDISKRKEAEHRLEDSRRQLATLMSNLPGMAYRCRNEPNWPMTFVSEGCEQLTGYTAGELSDANNEVIYADLIAEEDRDMVWKEVQRAVVEQRPFKLQYRIRHRSGEVRWVWEQGRVVSGDGDEANLEGFISDVHQRVEMEEALRNSESKYRALVEQMRNGIIVVQGTPPAVKFANPGIEAMTGFDTESLTRAVGVLLEQVPDNLEDKSIRFEHEWQVADGNWIWVDVSASPVHYRGTPALQLMLVDITGRKRAQLELERRDRILDAVSYLAGELVRVPDPYEVFEDCARRIGEASYADRVCIYRKAGEENRGAFARECLWFSNRADAIKAAPEVLEELNEMFGSELSTKLRSGEIVHGKVGALPDSVRARFTGQGAGYVIYVPVIVKDELWGFFGLATQDRERTMSQGEVDALRVMADTIASAVERHKNRIRLLESEAYWRSVVYNAPSIILTATPEGKITFVNQGAVGLTREEITGSSVFGYVDASHIEQFKKDYNRVLRTGESVNGEFLGPPREDPRWYQVTIGPINQDDTVTGLTVISTDITVRKEASEQIRASEEKLRNIITASPMGIHLYRLEAGGRLVFEGSNPAADEILGVDNSAFVGKTIEEAFPNLAGTEVPERYVRAARDGERWHTEQFDYEGGGIRGAFEVVAFQTSPGRMATLFMDITERARAQRALRESERRYRSLVEDQTEMIVRWRPDGTRIYVNDVYCRYFGISQQEAIGTSFLDLVVESERDQIKQKLDSLSAESPSLTDEHRVILPDGRVGWNQWTDRGLFDEDGNLVELQSVGRDITVRREAQDALRANEAALRAIFKAAPIGIGVARDRTLIRVNEGFCEMLGYKQMEVLGRDALFMYQNEAEYERVGDVLYTELRKKGLAVLETQLARKDGVIIDVLLRCVYVNYAAPEEGIIFTAIDISDRKRALEALRESEERFRLAFRTTPDAISITRVSDGLYIDINEGFTEETGFTREDVIGKTSLDSGIWAYPEERQDFVKHLTEHGRFRNHEYHFRRKDGSDLVGLMSATVMHLNKEPHVLAVTRNIQELKDIQEALREEATRAERYLDTAATIMVAIDPGGRIMLINRIGSELLGYEEEELIGEDWFDTCIPDDERELVRSVFERTVVEKADMPEYYENRILTRSGRELLVGWYNNVVTDEHGQFQSTLSSGIDITERRRMEQELQAAHEQLARDHETLQQKNYALKEVLSRIEEEKDAVKRSVLENVESHIMPSLQKLRAMGEKHQQTILDILEQGIEQITSGFAAELKDQYKQLTPRQIQICRLIKNGYTSKDIAEAIGTSLLTVHKHREAIREKLGLKNKNVNLNSYLQSL